MAPAVAVLFIASLKVMTTAVSVATLVAPTVGAVIDAVGAVESIFTLGLVTERVAPAASITVRTMLTLLLIVGVVQEYVAGDENPVRSCTPAIGFTVADTV
jgi:hypothetical protein